MTVHPALEKQLRRLTAALEKLLKNKWNDELQEVHQLALETLTLLKKNGEEKRRRSFGSGFLSFEELRWAWLRELPKLEQPRKHNLDEAKLVEKARKHNLDEAKLVEKARKHNLDEAKLVEKARKHNLDEPKLVEKARKHNLDEAKLAEKARKHNLDEAKLAEKARKHNLDEAKLVEKARKHNLDEAKLAEKARKHNLDEAKLVEKARKHNLEEPKLLEPTKHDLEEPGEPNELTQFARSPHTEDELFGKEECDYQPPTTVSTGHAEQAPASPEDYNPSEAVDAEEKDQPRARNKKRDWYKSHYPGQLREGPRQRRRIDVAPRIQKPQEAWAYEPLRLVCDITFDGLKVAVDDVLPLL